MDAPLMHYHADPQMHYHGLGQTFYHGLHLLGGHAASLIPLLITVIAAALIAAGLRLARR